MYNLIALIVLILLIYFIFRTLNIVWRWARKVIYYWRFESKMRALRSILRGCFYILMILLGLYYIKYIGIVFIIIGMFCSELKRKETIIYCSE